eukprot:Phypoly_transcript_11575.p1 GENE.Phypoly_transcript_11575~~Phypoly_transcript_11575.p1  ORF type:complete len:107 (-),score=15.96 Phypoly_transcript_11575:98-418(-)
MGVDGRVLGGDGLRMNRDASLADVGDSSNSESSAESTKGEGGRESPATFGVNLETEVGRRGTGLPFLCDVLFTRTRGSSSSSPKKVRKRNREAKPETKNTAFQNSF